MTATVITPTRFTLRALERRSKAVWNFMVATAIECGGTENPACKQMVRATVRELMKTSVVYDQAERRAAR